MQIEMTIKGLMVDPDHQHADRHPARQGRAARAADLGRHLRGQRHRAADRERRDAAADDARPAAERHPRPQRPQSRRSSSATCKENTFYALIYLARRTATRWRSTRGRATRSRWRCATRAPIFVEDTVIDNAKTVDFAPEKGDAERLQKWLESLDPDDLGKYKM